MDILEVPPLRAGALLFRSALRQTTLTLVCKATYRLDPGKACLVDAGKEEPLAEEDNYWDDDPARSLRTANDLIPAKPRADVVLVGQAQRPSDPNAASTIVRLYVGSIEKAVEVFPPRHILEDGTMRIDAWPLSIPLRYERSVGGPETNNPVGLRPDAPADKLGAVAMPNLCPVAVTAGRPSAPLGFGPIAPMWPTRLNKAAKHTAHMSPENRSTKPFPDDFDFSYFNLAPEDQQTESLHPDERIVLENVVPRHPRFETRLSGHQPRAFVRRATGRTEAIGLRCDTLWIDAPTARVWLVWRGHVLLTEPDEPGVIVAGLSEPGQDLGWADLARRAGIDPAGSVELKKRSSTITIDQNEVHPSALPFQPVKPGEPVVMMQPAEPQRPPPQKNDPSDTLVLEKRGLLLTILPFASGSFEQGLSAKPLVPTPVPEPSEWPLPPALLSHPPNVPIANVDKPQPARIHRTEAAEAGVLQASNAAAQLDDPRTRAPETPTRAPVVPKRPIAVRREAVELLWLDSAYGARIRRVPAWKKLASNVKPRQKDDDYEADGSTEARKEARERREVLVILRSADPSDAVGLSEALADAMEDGTFTPPLVIVGGVLSFPFDEVARLEATIAATSPLAAGDKALKEFVDTASALLQTPWLNGAGSIATGITSRLVDLFGKTHKSLGETYLREHTDRMLLQKRKYQRRTLLGKEWLRAVLAVGTSESDRVPTYLPDELNKDLPMFQRFDARVIAEVRPRLDEDEAHGIALRCVALGRLVRGI